MRLCVFDFDSTLMDGETIDFLAEAKGCGPEVEAITSAAMNGELDFFESLSRRVKLLEGLPYATAKEICENLPFITGAAETIAGLKTMGYTVVVFSGGFQLATAHARGILGFDMDFSNILHQKEGTLTGLVGGEMMFGDSKGIMLSKLQSLLGATPATTIAVGDGANDRSMFAHAATRVAFCAKDALKKEANVIIDTKDLRQILEIAKGL